MAILGLIAGLVMTSQINHQIQLQRQQQQPSSQDFISVQGIPSVTIQDNHLFIGNSQSSMFLKNNPTPMCHLSLTFQSRFNALVYAPQNSRRWFFWHGMALRLAWNVTPKHSSFADAVWSWRKAGMGRETSRSSQKNEEKMGGWLG